MATPTWDDTKPIEASTPRWEDTDGHIPEVVSKGEVIPPVFKGSLEEQRRTKYRGSKEFQDSATVRGMSSFGSFEDWARGIDEAATTYGEMPWAATASAPLAVLNIVPDTVGAVAGGATALAGQLLRPFGADSQDIHGAAETVKGWVPRFNNPGTKAFEGVMGQLPGLRQAGDVLGALPEDAADIAGGGLAVAGVKKFGPKVMEHAPPVVKDIGADLKRGAQLAAPAYMPLVEGVKGASSGAVGGAVMGGTIGGIADMTGMPILGHGKGALAGAGIGATLGAKEGFKSGWGQGREVGADMRKGQRQYDLEKDLGVEYAPTPSKPKTDWFKTTTEGLDARADARRMGADAEELARAKGRSPYSQYDSPTIQRAQVELTELSTPRPALMDVARQKAERELAARVEYDLPTPEQAAPLIPSALADKPFNATAEILNQTSPEFRAAGKEKGVVDRIQDAEYEATMGQMGDDLTINERTR